MKPQESYFNFFNTMNSIELVFAHIEEQTPQHDDEIEALRARLEIVIDQVMFETAKYGWVPKVYEQSGFDYFFQDYNDFVRRI